MKRTLSIYGSHDASVTFVDKNNILRVLEYERFSGTRYSMYSDKFDSFPLGSNDETRKRFLNEIKKNLFTDQIETIVYNELSTTDIDLLRTFFPRAEFEKIGHHNSHAACGYYQSPFTESLVFSLDGGGWDDKSVSMSKIYIGLGENLSLMCDPKVDMGNPYGMIGCPISEIRPGKDSDTHSLTYAGKIMGLCAYGKIRQDWISPMLDFYENPSLETLGKRINLNLSLNSIKEQDSYDLAATSQFIFEQKTFDLIYTYITKFNTNVVLTGGCALNVLFNQKLKEYMKTIGKDLYIPPNPNDCGLSLGQFLVKHPHRPKNLSYNGWEILDLDKLDYYIEKYKAVKITEKDIVSLISDKKIVGLVYGNSEIGPRALGNRSIICDPSFADMKSMLNEKVKFREWYRPFAPVSKLEDGPKYFDNCPESEYMSYAPNVKIEFRDKLKSITHYDGTSRLQTVTFEQHEIFYNILSEMESAGKIPVILNTSFNILGKPILTKIEDALYVLDHTSLDHVVIEGFLFSKIS